jgi:hypothetical protein
VKSGASDGKKAKRYRPSVQEAEGHYDSAACNWPELRKV